MFLILIQRLTLIITALASAEIKVYTTNQVDQSAVKLNNFFAIVNQSFSNDIWSLFEDCNVDNHFNDQLSQITGYSTNEISILFSSCNIEGTKLEVFIFKQEFDGSRNYYYIQKLEFDTTESRYQEIADLIGTIDSDDKFYFVQSDNKSTNYYIVQAKSLSNDGYDDFIGIRFQHQSTFSGYKTLINTSNERHLQFLQKNFLNRLGKH